MIDQDLRLLTRAATEQLEGAEAERLTVLLEGSREARETLADLRAAIDVVGDASFGTFSTHFVEDVMARVAGTRGTVDSARLADSMVSVFCRVAVAAAVIVVGLVTLNLTRASDLSGSALDAALAMPTVSFDAAYEMEARALFESFLGAGTLSPVTVPTPPAGAADSNSSGGTS